MPPPLVEERLSTAVGKIQLRRAGHGRPVVYLHSAMGEGAGLELLEDLADSFEVLAPVFPGFGESEGLEQIDGIEDAAFHTLDVIEQLGLERPPVLVGLSLGGWMALEVATRWSDRLDGLVVVNPVGLHLDGAPIKDIFGRDPAELARDLFADANHPLVQAAQHLSGLNEQKLALPFELVKPLMQSMAATAKVGWDPYLHNPKLRGRLHRIRVPTLVVHGEEDRLLPRAYAETFAAEIPGARLVDVPGAGHLLALERPAELVGLVRDLAGS